MTNRLDLHRRYRDQIEALLRQHVPEAEVWAYGSRVNGQCHEASDLDLALRSPSLEPLGYEYVELVEALEQSNIPILVQVHDWARLPESFHREIERDYVVVQRGLDQPNGIEANAWIEVPFAHLLAEPVRNGIYKKKEFHGAGVKIVNMGELFSNPRLRDVPMRRVKLSDSEQGRLDVRVGDLLFARRSLVAEGAGKCSVVLEVSEPTTFESSIIRARPDTSKADPQFLYYYFNSPPGLHALDSIRRHVAVAGITGSDLAQLEVLLPPLREQRAIAHILGTLDDKIELNRRMNETLEEMARAIFQDWFVDFGPVRAKLESREPYLPPELWDLFPDRLMDSELGEIPEGWEVKALGEVIDVLGGTTPSTKRAEYWEGGTHCWATPKDLSVLSSPVILDTERKITDAGIARIPSGLLPAGTLLLSSRAPIGYLAICQIPVAINQGFIAVPPGKAVSNHFMLHWSQAFHDEIVKHANGSTFLEISKSNFRKIGLVVPHEQVLAQFDARVQSLYERIVTNERESRYLAAQRDALLPKLVSGELRVQMGDPD